MTKEMERLLEVIEHHLSKAATLLHDTGDYESQELDDATTAVEVALSKIKQV
jgi:HD superfamily phosphodiesterase